MDRCAVFVDAGYLFAQGSACLTGSKKSRTQLILNAQEVVAQLKAVVFRQAPHSALLRVYWYDGAISGHRPTSDQALVAHLDDVKLRLGFVNTQGQQKGVDSLIVTDLIELARLKSICDAVLLSGDEDTRIGVQIAQSYGIRVHLLGITPSRASQSQQLMQEADTTIEWNRDTIAEFLSVREAVPEMPHAPSVGLPSAIEGPLTAIENAVQDFVASLPDSDIQGIFAYWETDRGVPPDLDRRLLAVCREALGRQLARDEIRHMRTGFREASLERILPTPL